MGKKKKKKANLFSYPNLLGKCLGKAFYPRNIIMFYCKDDKTSPVSLEPKSHVLDPCCPFLPQG